MVLETGEELQEVTDKCELACVCLCAPHISAHTKVGYEGVHTGAACGTRVGKELHVGLG